MRWKIKESEFKGTWVYSVPIKNGESSWEIKNKKRKGRHGFVFKKQLSRQPWMVFFQTGTHGVVLITVKSLRKQTVGVQEVNICWLFLNKIVNFCLQTRPEDTLKMEELRVLIR